MEILSWVRSERWPVPARSTILYLQGWGASLERPVRPLSSPLATGRGQPPVHHSEVHWEMERYTDVTYRTPWSEGAWSFIHWGDAFRGWGTGEVGGGTKDFREGLCITWFLEDITTFLRRMPPVIDLECVRLICPFGQIIHIAALN